MKLVSGFLSFSSNASILFLSLRNVFGLTWQLQAQPMSIPMQALCWEFAQSALDDRSTVMWMTFEASIQANLRLTHTS
jgi:hypothetical protein